MVEIGIFLQIAKKNVVHRSYNEFVTEDREEVQPL